jgi:hypothetical protein
VRERVVGVVVAGRAGAGLGRGLVDRQLEDGGALELLLVGGRQSSQRPGISRSVKRVSAAALACSPVTSVAVPRTTAER